MFPFSPLSFTILLFFLHFFISSPRIASSDIHGPWGEEGGGGGVAIIQYVDLW